MTSIPVYGSLKRYWSRRSYSRLKDGFNVKKNIRVLRLGGYSSRRRSSWRIRAIPKLQLKMKYPMKMWRKLRDGYINMMLGFAGNVGGYSDNSVFGGKRIPRSRPIPQISKYDSNEFDQRLALHIFNSLLASRELVATR
ncbi:uncharacterized protein LOC122079603 [Macadamia integrifolia]|uniref:uncharacterized protein LOC122063394 n=1 Tax=Macadamia integrifolia TaxID=60698 RepID=UPI001C4F64B8|nr:uncharacterized protein LOC122063394 [Macadamia integrifolia]XP_042502142.1 uncharacterized protein LOC122079603 [Macadamia integrifolia]